MGSRKQKRQIAKARLTAMGFGRVNRGMSKASADGIPNWRRVLEDENAERAQMNLGKLLKAKKEGKDIVRRRKLKKVTA